MYLQFYLIDIHLRKIFVFYNGMSHGSKFIGVYIWAGSGIIIIELTHSKTILENTVGIEPQPVALDFKNLSQYSSRSK